MPSQIGNRREYILEKLTLRKQKRAIRKLYKQLLIETDPIAYRSVLADIFSAQAQLYDLTAQISDWEMRGECLSHDKARRKTASKDLAEEPLSGRRRA